MINGMMREYPFYTYSGYDEYAQQQLSETPQGYIKMAIHLTTQNNTQNIMYENATYIGLTLDSKVNNTYVIEYGNERLKVLYVSAMGRFKQVYLAKVNK